ncbi:DoxX family protein [Aquabacter spiritensis]|uniref:Putative oxidoreductase n=1 Tax=Aquabacter spiritensis TaxID=933073 RepID=A0A4R3LZG3_9HYPH|nr:DoxX family protein [Aquabacter spiritensis]TCT05696.1 putative oxidoreductase [Aquabacter spiritensis]
MSNDAALLMLALGRILLGGLFVYGGVRHFFILPAVSSALAARGVPGPRLVLIVGSVFELVAGALLAAGVFVRPAALGLVLFTAAACVLLLNFWDMKPGPERETAKNFVQSNMAIIGGLLIAAATAS